MTKPEPKAEPKPQPPTKTIEKKIEIDAPVEAVWTALTNAEELERWFPLEARVKPGAGGSIWLSWGPGCEAEAPIAVWEPNRHLQQREKAPGATEPGAAAPDGASARAAIVDWTLEDRGGKTLLRLVNSGFVEGAEWENEHFDSTNYGWTFILTNLRHYLERHRGTPRRVAWPRIKIEMPREVAYERLLASDGLFRDASLAGLKAGETFGLRASTEETFMGRVEFIAPPRGFCLRIENLNEALLWLSIEGSGGHHEVGLWLSAYGLPQSEVDGFGQRWSAALEKLFPTSREPEQAS
jgi:uncharacterized protein YndB with AHSA1/START domain